MKTLIIAATLFLQSCALVHIPQVGQSCGAYRCTQTDRNEAIFWNTLIWVNVLLAGKAIEASF